MLTGTKLGIALNSAIDRLITTPGSGYTSRTALANALKISGPAISAWCKTGSIKKDRLFDLWKILSHVVPPEHFGLTAWPWAENDQTAQVLSEPPAPYNPHQWLIDAYLSADKSTRAAIELLLTPSALLSADPLTTLAAAQLKQSAQKALLAHKSGEAAA
jgi:hypothetical protein